MTFTEAMDHVAQGFEAFGAAVLVLGLVWSLVFAAVVWRRSGNGRVGYEALRETFGGVLLLGLEILVAADLIRTVAVAPTLENVGVLGLIVLIRTFLSFSLRDRDRGGAAVPRGGSWRHQPHCPGCQPGPTTVRPGDGSSDPRLYRASYVRTPAPEVRAPGPRGCDVPAADVRLRHRRSRLSAADGAGSADAGSGSPTSTSIIR